MRTIPSSELIINDDGSIFHLHLKPDQIADTIILVGDPGRVAQVAARFESREFSVSSREFHTVTGSYKGRRMTVLSHGIGTDNIDIVVTELDALANIDFATRQVKPEHKRLTMLRLGTSGALQSDLAIGDLVFARTSVGFDGLLNYYDGRDKVCDGAIERAFVEHTGWSPLLPAPYFVDADEELFELFRDSTKEGVTVSAPGFYGPQGRHVRLQPADPRLNDKIESFRYADPNRAGSSTGSGSGGDRRITNFEMESSALAGLSKLMGHRAATICTIIAQRVALDMETDYKPFVERMIDMSLDRLAEL
ncbi:MAG: nucleoside phosphorylase [Alistipes sp.]|jgi:uridine phosphorylase|nr:nucleoside phosphorylase [Alistipes sp.]